MRSSGGNRSDEAREGELLPGGAARFASGSFPITRPGEQAGALRHSLEGRRFDTAAQIAVCEGDSLVGLVRIEDLLAAPATTPVANLMDTDPPRVDPDSDQELVAWKAVQHGESSLAVVDRRGALIGLIPPHRLMGVLLQEHDEDLARLGGYLRDAGAARLASQEPILQRFLHRLPWLLVGLAGALLAALPSRIPWIGDIGTKGGDDLGQAQDVGVEVVTDLSRPSPTRRAATHTRRRPSLPPGRGRSLRPPPRQVLRLR
jgi:hypothetical protein